MTFSDFFRHLSYAVFPRRCLFCGKLISPRETVCADCREAVERIVAPFCPHCGCGKERCTCAGHKTFYDALAAPFYYSGVMRMCIHRFKFKNERGLALPLSAEMVKAADASFGEIEFDMVCCVPMTKRERRDRGYNQSALLAKHVAKRLGVPFHGEIIEKYYETRNQRDLPHNLRRGNVAGAFDIADVDLLTDKTVLVCDDVKTSGSTLDECAKMLKMGGAARVYCLTAAVTYIDKEKEEAEGRE